MKKLLRNLFLCSSVLFLCANVVAQEEEKEDSHKVDEAPVVEGAEITGVVSKKVDGNAVSYTLKTSTGTTLVLPSKSGEDVIDYVPFVGKTVLVVAQVVVKVKTDAEGNETKTVESIKVLESIDEVVAE